MSIKKKLRHAIWQFQAHHLEPTYYNRITGEVTSLVGRLIGGAEYQTDEWGLLKHQEEAKRLLDLCEEYITLTSGYFDFMMLEDLYENDYEKAYAILKPYYNQRRRAIDQFNKDLRERKHALCNA